MSKNLFCSRLRELRGDLSQEDFAHKIGTKQTTLSNWERGFREPNFSGLALISTSCEVSADWLLGLTDDRGGVAPRTAQPSQLSHDKNLAELKAENVALKGEIRGLQFALDSALKGARRAQASASNSRPA